MSILKSLVLLLIFILIKIGDGVIFLFHLLKGFFHKWYPLFQEWVKRINLSLVSRNRALALTSGQKENPLSREENYFSTKTINHFTSSFSTRKLFAKKRGRPRKKKPFFPKILFMRFITLFRKVLLSLLKISAKVIVVMLISVGYIFVIFRNGITFPFRLRFHHKKRGRKKHKESKKTVYSAPLFYKFKLIIIGTIISCIFVFVPLVFIVFITDLPNLEHLSLTALPKTTKIFDRHGVLLYEIYANQNRTIVTLDEIPKSLRDATIAIEDKDFYYHPGFDIKGIARAFFSNIQHEGLQGGSTITQQLIKSAFFSPEPSISRKVKEIVLAFWAERQYSKNEILELYFNYVPYGGTAWGINSASEIYFGKKLGDLTLAESAFLAGLPRAPSIYSPYNGSDKKWKGRQKDVLGAMVRLGYVSKQEADEAYKSELVFKKPEISIRAPHFVMYVRDQLIKKYGLSEVERGGLQVTTTLDLGIQEIAERNVIEQVEQDKGLNIKNGASLVTNPQNGDVLAMVGSRDYFAWENDGNVNITRALRQPGSTIKIVTYSLALSSGFTEATILDDSPLTIRNEGESPYIPVNYDGRFHGRVPLRTAFANSFNIPAVRVTQKLGVDALIEQGRAMGITSWVDPSRYGVSITLGGGDLTMLELATVYGTVANAGERMDLDPVLEITDSYGKTVYTKSSQGKKVLDPGVAFIISDILADNQARSMAFGTNSPLSIAGKRVSVKTGTTDNKRDNWTIGYTPNLLVATWVGNNDNSPMSPALTSGITGAAPMWNKIIHTLLKETSVASVTMPENIVKRSCNGKDTYFIRGTESLVSCGSFFAPITTTPFRR